MYELYKLEENLYQIHSAFLGEKSMEGTLIAILTYAVYTLGFRIDDLEAAILDMNERDLDGAHFGVNRTFLFSFDRKKKKAS